MLLTNFQEGRWLKWKVVLAAVFVMLTAAPKLVAQTVTIETLRQVVAAFNSHDLDRVMSFFADDCVLEMPRGPEPWGTRYVGKAEVRKGLATRFEGLPDVHYSDDEHWISDDQEFPNGLFRGLQRTERRFKFMVATFFNFVMAR